MLARNEVIFKWALYAVTATLFVFLQGALLQRLTVWGVIPFLYPLLAVIPSTYEAPLPGAIFALCSGIFCDLLLPEPIPCLYTLVFPISALCAAALSRSLLRAGFLCSLAASAAAFLLTDLFRCFLLWMSGQQAWRTGVFLMVREFCVTAPLVLPVTALYRIVFRKTHVYD